MRKNVIQVWIGGNYENEELSDEQIVQDLNDLFKQFIPHEKLADPVKVIR